MRGSTLGLGTLVLFLATSAACGGAAPAVTPSLSSSPPQAVRMEPQAAPSSAPVESAPPIAPAIPRAEPTALTEAQRLRDASLMPKIAPIVDAFANKEPELTKDRKRVLFRSNREGSWQAYLGDTAKPNAAPLRLTHLPHDERVMSARLTQDEKYVLFTSDEGADENFRIYRVKLDGSDLVDLTPNDKLHRDEPLLPRLRPSQMVYSARDNARSSTDVFVQGIRDSEAREPRKVYSDPAPGYLLDVSPDGSHALFLRTRGPSDHVLFRLDLDEGTATRLFPQSEKKTVRVTGGAYSADGKRAYIATDDGADASYLLRIEPGSGVVSGRYKEESPATAQLADVVVSPKDDRVAVVIDAGNHTETRILDDALRPVAMVKSPLGTIDTGRFASDGKSFTAYLSSADKPGDIFDVDVTTGAMKALRADARAGLATVPRLDVSIAAVNGEGGVSIPINVYLPPVKKEKLPVIVNVHGGPASSARAGWNTGAMVWASLGYAVVEPNVRGSTGFGRSWELADNRDKRGVALADLASVNAWVREQAWADGDRIVVTGASYGGYMTLMALSRQPGMWRAGIDLVGISDLRTFFRGTSGAIRSILANEFGDPEKDGELLARLSPMTAVDKITAPLFVYQGANDPRVPRAEADAIVTALRERKVPVEYMLAENEGHSYDRRETKLALYARAARFLDENVPKSTAPQPIAKK